MSIITEGIDLAKNIHLAVDGRDVRYSEGCFRVYRRLVHLETSTDRLTCSMN